MAPLQYRKWPNREKEKPYHLRLYPRAQMSEDPYGDERIDSKSPLALTLWDQSKVKQADLRPCRLKCLRVRGAVCGKLLGLDEVKGIDQRRVAPTLKPRDRRLVTKNWKV